MAVAECRQEAASAEVDDLVPGRGPVVGFIAESDDDPIGDRDRVDGWQSGEVGEDGSVGEQGAGDGYSDRVGRQPGPGTLARRRCV